MAMKSRILFLLKYLYENTDDAYPLTGTQLRGILRDNGIPVPDIRTLRNDITMLINAGFDIVAEERTGLSTLYYYGRREWETAELRILIDAVSSSRFISETKSSQLISKLSSLAGSVNAPYLKPGMFVPVGMKAKGNHLLYVVQRIEEGITQKRKISFQYYNYNIRKEQIKRNSGEIYTVSPYATVWNTDRYYMVCWSDKHQKVVCFRIDRMGIPTVTEELSVPMPRHFNPKSWSEMTFKMYSGEETAVTLRCDYDMMDHIIDRFGTGVPLENITEDTFDISVPVSVSPTFYAWVFQYAGAIRIIEPDSVRDGYLRMLETGIGTAKE